MNSRPTPITLSSERLQVLHVQLERIISRVILSGEHLRLLDDARQAPASLDGLPSCSTTPPTTSTTSSGNCSPTGRTRNGNLPYHPHVVLE